MMKINEIKNGWKRQSKRKWGGLSFCPLEKDKSLERKRKKSSLQFLFPTPTPSCVFDSSVFILY